MKKPPGHKQWPCSWSESAHGLYSVMPTALCACRTSHLSLHILQKTSWATQKNQFPICGHRQASYSSASLRTLGTMPLCYPAPASLFFTFATALSEDPWPPFVSGAPWCCTSQILESQATGVQYWASYMLSNHFTVSHTPNPTLPVRCRDRDLYSAT